MSVRSKRLAGPTALPAATYVTVYTCPASETAIIKRLAVSSGGLVDGDLYVRINSTTGGSSLLFSRKVTGLPSLDHETWWILHPGDTLHVWCSVANYAVSLHGTELEGVAD